MKARILSFLSAGVLLCAVPASAQSGAADAGPVSRFGVAFRAGFNVTASFKNLGGYGPTGSPGTTNGLSQDRFYDDGYVRIDSSTNANHLTWFWGYQHGEALPGEPVDPLSQVRRTGPTTGSVLMHSTYSAADVASRDRDGDPQCGIEFTYNLEWRAPAINGFWGLEAAFNYMDLEIVDARPLIGNTSLIEDAFPFTDISLLPQATPGTPYTGQFEVAGASLGDVPARTITTTPGGVSITGNRRIDGSVYGFRLGPTVRFPIGESVSVALGGGLAFAHVDSRFSFLETVTLTGVGSTTTSGRDSRDEFLVGGYVGGSVIVDWNDKWSFFAGTQFQSLGSYSHHSGAKIATVDLGQTIFVTAGIHYSF